MNNKEEKIKSGELDLTKIFSDVTNKITLSCPVKKINFDNAEDKFSIIGMQLLVMDEEYFNKIEIDDCNLNDDTLLCISQYQVIEDISIINGALNMMAKNAIITDYEKNRFIDQLLSDVIKNGYIRYKEFMDNIEYMDLFNKDDTKYERLLDRLMIITKSIWFMAYNVLDELYESAVKEFNKNKGNK